MNNVESKTSILKVNLPAPSLASKSFTPIHYQDAYQCTFNNKKSVVVEDCVMAFFTYSPPFISTLFALRNKLMKPLGLKVSDTLDRQTQLRNFTIEKGNALGIFKVIDKTDNEVNGRG